jgi:hypothetical protein
MPSIEEIENDYWGTTPVNSSKVIEACYFLRKKEINELTDDELRIAISQDVGVPIILPIILKKLQINPLIEATYFPGDLLLNLLRYLNHNPIDKNYHRLIKEIIVKMKTETGYCDLTNEILDEIEVNSSIWLSRYTETNNSHL